MGWGGEGCKRGRKTKFVERRLKMNVAFVESIAGEKSRTRASFRDPKKRISGKGKRSQKRKREVTR